MLNLPKYRKPKIVAEIGCNHMGDIEIAHEMIKTAKIFCKADVIKFQKRNPKELLTENEYNSPHPVPRNSYGETYGEHREYLEFKIEQHRKLKKWCEELDIIYSTSVWDLTSAKEIVSINPSQIKIPSACNLNKKLLEYLCDNYSGEIHVSTGMTTPDEINQIVNYFEKKNRIKDIVLYNCTSGYPVPFEDISLLEILNLRKKYEGRVKAIGFSGHHLGVAVDSAAYTLGAEWIERHYTLDRTWKGTDHAASLEPNGIRMVVRDLNALYKALRFKQKPILEIEKQQRDKLKRSQIRWEKQ